MASEPSGVVAAAAVVVAVTEPEPQGASTNPMLIDLVIDNMFGYCDFKTLARCRQVSKQWFKISLPHWLNQGAMLELLLDDVPSQPRYRRTETYMSEFLQLVNSPTTSTSNEEYKYCGLRQYKKFYVRGHANNERHRELLAEFLRDYGQRITDLKLTMTFADMETYQTVMLSRKTPNLVKLEAADVWFDKGVDFENAAYYEVEHDDAHEKLKTLQVDFTPYGRRPPLPVPLWIQLLRRYPNLETLVHGLARASRPQNADNMLEAVWTIRQADKKALDLKRLEVCCGERNYDDVGSVRRPYQLNSLMPPLFRDAQLKLETFSISIGGLTPSQTIYEVLDSQAASLKSLVLHNHKFGPLEENFIQPPEMDCVKALELRGAHCPFPNLVFLNGFPNLESLTLNFEYNVNVQLRRVLDATKEEMLLEGLLTLPTTISKFHCNSGYVIFESFTPEQIRKLHRIMPNLTDLQMWLDNESFRAVCECWPGLQSLRIVGDRVDDDGLLGRIDRDGNMSINIRNLKELESFSMMHVGFNKQYLAQVDLPMAVTGACVNPLLHLPNLKKLEITLDYKEYERGHARLLNISVVRVEGREIDVSIKFAYPLDESDDEGDSDDYSGYFGTEDEWESYDGQSEDENNESSEKGNSDEDEDNGGAGVKEETEKEDSEKNQDGDGDPGVEDKGENNEDYCDNENECDADERGGDGEGVEEEAENDGGKTDNGVRDDGESQEGGGGVDDGVA